MLIAKFILIVIICLLNSTFARENSSQNSMNKCTYCSIPIHIDEQQGLSRFIKYKGLSDAYMEIHVHRTRVLCISLFATNKISVDAREEGRGSFRLIRVPVNTCRATLRSSQYRCVSGGREKGPARERTHIHLAQHYLSPLCPVRRRALFEYTRLPLDIETDIPFCNAVHPPYGGGVGGAVVVVVGVGGGGDGGGGARNPFLTLHPPLFLRHLHLHRHLLGRLCRLRVRRRAVCSSFPSVCRPPSVENHVFAPLPPPQWWCVMLRWRGVVIARLLVPLANDNRPITGR